MLVVGIAGGTGSGKTTVVNRILERLPEDKVSILSQGGNNQVAIDILTTIILERLKGH